jgi:hypothetical protein
VTNEEKARSVAEATMDGNGAVAGIEAAEKWEREVERRTVPILYALNAMTAHRHLLLFDVGEVVRLARNRPDWAAPIIERYANEQAAKAVAEQTAALREALEPWHTLALELLDAFRTAAQQHLDDRMLLAGERDTDQKRLDERVSAYLDRLAALAAAPGGAT